MDEIIEAFETLESFVDEVRVAGACTPDDAWKLLMAAEILAGRLRDFIMEPGNGR